MHHGPCPSVSFARRIIRTQVNQFGAENADGSEIVGPRASGFPVDHIRVDFQDLELVHVPIEYRILTINMLEKRQDDSRKLGRSSSLGL
jgi:hypothetical protein